jgi:hypothetical protein
MELGSFCACEMAVSVWVRTRSSSAGAKVGRWTTSAKRSSEGPMLADSADRVTRLRSAVPLVPTSAPSRSCSSAICWEVLPSAPSSSSDRVRFCKPRAFGASAEKPASNASAICVTGTAERCA